MPLRDLVSSIVGPPLADESIPAHEPLDQLSATLMRAASASPGFKAVECSRWSFNGTSTDPLRIRTRAGTSTSAAWIRVVRIDGGEQAQILNAAIFPAPWRELPVLGMSVMVLRGRLHLVVLDIFWLGEPGLDSQSSMTLELAHRIASQSHELHGRPSWGEHAFSPRLLLLRPGVDALTALGPVSAMFRSQWSAWLDDAGERPEQPHDRDVWARRLERYIHDHTSEEPSRPYLERMTSPAWAAAFVNEVLFPARLIPAPTGLSRNSGGIL